MIVPFHSNEVHADTIRKLIKRQRDDGCETLTVEFVDKNVLIDLYLGETTTEPPTYRACKLLVDAVRKLALSGSKTRYHWSDLVPMRDDITITYESVTDISGMQKSQT